MTILRGLYDRIECMRVRPLLQPLLDGELDEGQRTRVAAHLEACRRCGLAASSFERIKADLDGSGSPVDAAAVARLEGFVDRLIEEDGDPSEEG